ncbi:MAG: Type 1 glutamine amidotransferase-like domain-containing protein [Patescibacteria group bacterium]
MNKKLLLSGGGDSQYSILLDRLLLELIPKGKKLLYIPIAWKGGDFDSCFSWFSSVFSNLGFNNFKMCTKLLNKKYEELEDFGAIYIGGGNTYLLMNDIKSSGFDKTLIRFIESGRPIYGGSAGAIIFGSNIDTAGFGGDSDKNEINIKDKSGFNLIGGYAIQCHYSSEQDFEIKEFVIIRGIPVLALPERSGVYVDGGKISVIGFESVYLFTGDKKVTYNPGLFLSI